MANLVAGSTTFGGVQVSPYGSVLTNFKQYTPTLSPAQVNANTAVEQTFTVTGLLADDTVITVSKPTAQSGIGIVGWRVSAANTLAITFANVTAGNITPTASEVYKVVVVNTYIN